MNISETGETDVLESLLPQFEAEGFDVFVQPSPSILPPFMQDYRPDAVALREDRKIAIEVVRSTGPSSKKVEDLQCLFARQPDWELRVFYVSPRTPGTAIEVASRPVILGAIQRVLDLKKEGHKLPALIMAWATLEAIGRALLPAQFRRPQTPGRLTEVLASQGYLTPAEADMLRAVIPMRNAAVHGGLDSVIDEQQLEQFVAVLQTLVEFLPSDDVPVHRPQG
jgi:uncharacterized protein YutE (UPF0331/DUF86 family)